MIEHRRLKAGSIAHAEIGCRIQVTTTSGVQVRDVLVGVIYGAEVSRGEYTTANAPDGPDLLLAFQNTQPVDMRSFSDRSRYYLVAADSVAIIYREEPGDTASQDAANG